jgi:tetratricopeptide (TPR) repeat protein
MFVVPILFLTFASGGCEDALKPIAAALQSHDLEKASTMLGAVPPECTASSAYHELAGITGELNGNYTTAANELQQALALNPGLANDPAIFLWLVQALLETEQSERLATFLSDKHPRLTPPLLFSLGTLFAKHRDYARAIKYFQQIPPELADDAVYFNLGLAHSHLRQFEDARRCYFQAIDKHPDHVESYFRVGLDFASSGDLRKALPWLFRARDFAPDRPDIAYALIEQLLLLQYVETASQVDAEALEANPRNPLLMLADGDVLLARAKTAEARTSYQAALLQQPRLSGALLGLARIDEINGDTAAARKKLLEALSTDPDNPFVNGELGAMEVKDGNWTDAYRYLTKAWSADESNRIVGLRLAQALEHLHRAGEALHLLQPLAPALHDSSAFHFEMVQIYAQLGRTADAQAEREKVATLQSASVNDIHFEAPKTYVH